MNKKILSILIVVILVNSLFGWINNASAKGLEYKYPALPGSPTQTITSKTSLGNLVKYLINWAIILGGIIAFISLIVAGISYITSGGNPGQMRTAQNRVYNAFLGLLILFGSYMILHIVNPQLMVMQISKKPAYLGVVLLSKEAYDQLTSANPTSTLDQLIFEQKAYYLNYSIPDLTKEFGDETTITLRISGHNVTLTVFENFWLYAIGFFKDTKNKVKILTFQDKQYEGNSIVYSYDGKLDSDGNVVTPADSSPVYNPGYLHLIKIEYFSNKTPLSIHFGGLGPGVYLYAENGEERYLIGYDYPDFGDSSMNFNDKARFISIKNDVGEDRLAVLYEDKNFRGQFRLFFEKKDRGSGEGEVGNTTSTKTKISEAMWNPGYGGSPGGYYTIMGEKDEYGRVNKPSSMKVFEISSDNNICRQVWLCTKQNLSGNCLIYLNKNEVLDVTQGNLEGVGIAFAKEISSTTIPFFKPINIPEKATFKVFDSSGNVIETRSDEDVADNIYSLKIVGNCLVSLFEHKTNDRRWPGSRSQVFSQTIKDDEESWLDLTDERICGCHPASSLWLRSGKSCASAIAIYPINPIFGGSGRSGGGAGGGY